jgi:predicted RNase H-like HicB family nuclease
MEQTTKDDWMRWNMKTSVTTMTSTPIKIKNQAKYYFCYCPIYDFWSVGRTREEAWRRLKEDLFLLMMKCSRHESRDKVFKEYSYNRAEIRA